jgi:hypothetical protein
MLSRSIAFIAAVALLASASPASAGLLGMPMNLKFKLNFSNTIIKVHAEERIYACMLHTDDIFAGPVTIWDCGNGI